MKKILTILTLCLLGFAFTANAQIVVGKEYRIKETGTGYYLNVDNNTAHAGGTHGGVSIKPKTTGDNQIFIFEEDGTDYKIKTKSGHYLYCQQWNVDALEAGTTIGMEDNGDGTYHIINRNREAYFKCEWVQNSNNYHPFGDADVSNAAKFELVETADAQVKVTYNYVLNGEVKKTIEVDQLVESAYSAPDLGIDYLTVTTPAGLVDADAANNVVNVECTQDLPFILSESYESAVWHQVTIRESNKKYLNKGNTYPYEYIQTGSYENNSFWAFAGNVFDGIKIWCKAASKSQTLGVDSPTSGNYPYMKSGDNRWTVVKGKYGFALTAGNDCYITDEYNTMKLKKNANAKNNEAFNLNAITEDEVATTLKNSMLNTLGFVGSYPEEERSTIETLSELNDLLTYVEENTAKKIKLTTETYYRIDNVANNFMVGSDGSNRINTEVSLSDISQIWLFEETSEPGFVNIKNANAKLYMQRPIYPTLVEKSSAQDYELVELSVGEFAIKVKGENSYLVLKNGILTNGLSPVTNSESAWHLRPATQIEVTMNEAQGQGWATVYLPFGVTLNENMKAWYPSSSDGIYMYMTETQKVPAETGIVLNSTTPGEYLLNIDNISTQDSDIQNNMLTGSLSDVPLSIEYDGEIVNLHCYYLIFGAYEDVPGFYNPISTAEVLKANKAFFNTIGGMATNSLKMNFGEATDIENVETQQDGQKVIYDLSGRRITTPQKGLYIINGKKMYIK